eukprot:COSAG01_NODE_13_length_41723_cov_145.394556_5_plen_84_part_00
MVSAACECVVEEELEDARHVFPPPPLALSPPPPPSSQPFVAMRGQRARVLRLDLAEASLPARCRRGLWRALTRGVSAGSDSQS